MNLKKEAAADTAAGQNKLQIRTYQKQSKLSNAKMLIGEILLFGNKKQEGFWLLFDTKIRQYYDIKFWGIQDELRTTRTDK